VMPNTPSGLDESAPSRCLIREGGIGIQARPLGVSGIEAEMRAKAARDCPVVTRATLLSEELHEMGRHGKNLAAIHIKCV